MRPSFGANLPQIVKYIWQKAFFKHALAIDIRSVSPYNEENHNMLHESEE